LGAGEVETRRVEGDVARGVALVAQYPHLTDDEIL